MKGRDILQTAWHNVQRRWVRTILTASGVAVGILVLVALLSFSTGLRREFDRQISRIGLEWVEVWPGGSFLSRSGDLPTHPLTPAVVEEWARRPDVLEVRTTIALPGFEYTFLEHGGKRLPVSLYDDALAIMDEPFVRPAQLIAGRDLRPGREGEVVLSQDVLLHLELTPEEALGQVITITLSAPRGEEASFPLTIVGVSDAPYREVRIGVKDREKMKSWWFNETDLLERRGYDGVALRAVSLERAQVLAEELDAAGYNVRTTKMTLEAVHRGTLILEAIMSMVAALALFVAGIGIANTMMMAIYERTAEIGLLKALGASRREVRRLFVSEAAAIGLLGGLAGVVLGWLLSRGLNRLAWWILQAQDVPVEGTFFVTTPFLVLVALAFGAAVGALAGLIPAGRAARLDPVQALREE